MPTLLLQKPSNTLKANYLKVLEIILRLWEEWNITTLVNESKTKHSNEYSKTFVKILAADAKR